MRPGPNANTPGVGYDESFCVRVIEWGRAGKSLTWMASQLDVHRVTVYGWMEAHPEFAAAMDIARMHCQAWWEDAGQSGMMIPAFSASAWSRSMAARFPEEWRETTRQEQTGKDGGPIQTEMRALVNVAECTDEQLRVLASIPIKEG